ncbi:MAG: hypothetical protein K8R18_01615 [Parvibaculum sp.]|uniref:COG4223 family protein n=1 Tax=Parvibaculum sp. TaxID=2024848 RepID=UPI0025D2440F|nr:mitofilin family membrane protein [Parvibaculum sp.]MCE9648297.1 hypothetical protein [Parvibaculum sp.]
MSDPNGKNETPAENEPEAELLGPERTRRAEARARKEPPVIEGVIEGDTKAAGEDASASTQGETVKAAAAPSRMSNLGVAVAAGVAGALVVGAVLYALGFGRTDAAGKSTLADFDARIASVEARSAESATRLGAAEEKISAAAQDADGAAAASARLDKVEADAAALKQSLGDMSAATQASQQKLDEMAKAMPPADIADQIGRLDAIVKALNTALDTLTPKINEMEMRVAALEAKKDDPDAAARAALGLALSNLSRAATGPGPFKGELDVVASFLPKEPELAALRDAAASGVPTEASLKARFPVLVQNVLDAERQAASDGLFQRFVANARKLITVRRTGEITGTDTDAVLARMEERLKLDDLPAAVVEAKGLTGAAAEAAKPWLKDAQARVATTQLLRDLTAHVTTRLAAGAKG